MSRYFSRPKKSSSDDFWQPLIPDLSVPDHRPVDTGLVDKRGDPIMRAPNPIGFHRP